ncbi:MAG: hypothetical protein AABN95_23150 [Acidobacteriota bacterium]
MSKSSMTVRDVFELPEPGADGSEGWKTFEDRVSKEIEGIKTAALPDIAEKVAELFEIPIPDIFLTSWKKAEGIQALLDESRKAPETVMNTELGEHTINSQHRPHIEIRIQNKAVKKIEFTLRLAFDLKGFVIKIQDGAIRGMQTGLCEVRGKLEYQGLVVAEKKLSPITLPGSISFLEPGLERKEEAAKKKPADTIAGDIQRGSRTPTDKVAAENHAHTRIVEEINAQLAKPVTSASSEIAKNEGAEISTPPETSVPEPPETSGTADAVDVETPPDTDVTEPQEKRGTIEAVGVNMLPKIAVAESQQTSVVVEENEERMTWEVGDAEEDTGTPHQATENAQDAIDRMSRELADSRQNGAQIEVADRAKAAS